MEMSSSSSIISPEDVLESLMNDGTIDAIRLKIINQLKSNEELRKTAITMVEGSKVLNTPGAEKQTKRELFDALRQELEVPVLEKASRSVWELMLDNNGLGREISETVEQVFCQLSGREPPFFPYPYIGTQSDKEKEEGMLNGKKNELGSDDENKNKEDNIPLKKQKFNTKNMEGANNDMVSSSIDPPAIPEDS